MSVHKHAVLVGSRSNIILDHFFVNPKMSIRVEVVILKMATKSMILGVIVVLTYLLTREPGRMMLEQLGGESEIGIEHFIPIMKGRIVGLGRERVWCTNIYTRFKNSTVLYHCIQANYCYNLHSETSIM